MAKSRRVTTIWMFLTASLLLGASSASAVDALFELKLAPSEADATLDLGNPADVQLDLEIWLTLSSPVNVTGWSAFLDLDLAEDNIISFSSASFVDEVGFDIGPLVQGTDNSPISGELSRGVAMIPPNVIPFGAAATHVASFSVNALNEGVVTYVFADGGAPRPWKVSLEAGGLANVSATTGPFEITVVPGPAPVWLMLAGSAWLLGGSRRRGRRRV